MTVGTTMVAPMVDLVSQPDSSFPGLQVHRFAQVTGDVRLKESVAIALGAVVRAEARTKLELR
jgi:carbonic anhydrase/acetyltransferase-like protein (isoleucine patch superfamily)